MNSIQKRITPRRERVFRPEVVANEEDVLDNQVIRNGEILNIKWPSGKVLTEKVRIHLSSYTKIDGTTVATRRAFVDVDYEGASARVYLVGALAERVK